MFGGAQPPQVRHQLVFVARRHQRRQQDHIRNLLIDRRNRRVAGLDQDQIRHHQLADDVPEDVGLPDIWFYREYQCHMSNPKIQIPSSNHSQIPTSNSNFQNANPQPLEFQPRRFPDHPVGISRWDLGFGSWEWLGFGAWSLGFD